MPFYHVWFATKKRKWFLEGELGTRTKELLREIADEKGIRMLECEAIVDHVHLLIEAEDTTELSKAMNLVKGVLARRLNQEFPELKFDLGVVHLWQQRYLVKVVPESAVAYVMTYIRTQWDRLEPYEG